MDEKDCCSTCITRSTSHGNTQRPGSWRASPKNKTEAALRDRVIPSSGGADTDDSPIIVIPAADPEMHEGSAVLAKMLALHAGRKVFVGARVERTALAASEFSSSLIPG